MEPSLSVLRYPVPDEGVGDVDGAEEVRRRLCVDPPEVGHVLVSRRTTRHLLTAQTRWESEKHGDDESEHCNI